MFLFLYEYIVREDSDYGFGWGFNFPELRKMVWALGQLKMPDIVLKILECQAYILANKNDGSNSESIKLAREWIDNVWEYEGNEELLNHLILVDGYKVIDYRNSDFF